jgi:hypothetical protein
MVGISGCATASYSGHMKENIPEFDSFSQMARVGGIISRTGEQRGVCE